MVPEIPVGETIESLVNFLRENLGVVFDIVSAVLGNLVDWLASFFQWTPPVILGLVVAGIGYLLRGIPFAIFTLLALLLIESMGMWDVTMATLALVLIASLSAVIIAIPVGILATRSAIVSTAVRPILDFMQTLPAFVYLIPAIFFFGIGVVPGAVATLIFAMPPAVRLTELGIKQVDGEIVEAAEAFGATPNQILFRVQIPLALPTIMAGINQVIMLSLSMVVIAGMVGAGGLGAEVFRSISTVNIGLGFESGISVVILAILLDRASEALGKLGNPVPA